MSVWLPVRLSLTHSQLEDARQSSQMSSSSATMSREELRESSLRVDSLSSQLAGLQKEVGAPCVSHLNRGRVAMGMTTTDA